MPEKIARSYMYNNEIVLATKSEIAGIHTAEQARELINKMNKIGQKTLFYVAEILQTVNAYRLYKDDGAKNIVEWCDKNFGYKKSNTHNLLNVALWVKDGKSKYATAENDFSFAQILQLQRLGDKKTEQLIEEKRISPDMTTAEIKKLVDSIKNVRVEANLIESAETPETDNESLSEITESDNKEIVSEIKKTTKTTPTTNKKTEINEFISEVLKKYGDKKIVFTLTVDGVQTPITFNYQPKDKSNK